MNASNVTKKNRHGMALCQGKGYPLMLSALFLTMASLGNSSVQAGPVQDVSQQEASTKAENSLGEAFLNRYFLLRENVKGRSTQRTTSAIAIATWGKSRVDAGNDPGLEAITVVTPRGVFYSSDYDVEEQVMESAADLAFRLGNTPIGLVPPTSVVTDIAQRTIVVLQRGQITRLARLQEDPRGYRVTLESFGIEPIDVLLRPATTPVVSVEQQDAALSRLLGLLLVDPSDESAVPGVWSAEVREAIAQGRVILGMDPQQVLLAWGSPVQVTTRRGGSAETWLFKRGATLVDQIRNRTNVSFWDGGVIAVESGPAWSTQLASSTDLLEEEDQPALGPVPIRSLASTSPLSPAEEGPQ